MAASRFVKTNVIIEHFLGLRDVLGTIFSEHDFLIGVLKALSVLALTVIALIEGYKVMFS
jgi:hypothetical protein